MPQKEWLPEPKLQSIYFYSEFHEKWFINDGRISWNI